MSSMTFHFLRPLHLLAMIALIFTLTACAGRPKPLEPSYPVSVTSVRVTAEASVDAGFALQLQERLENTLGRSTRDIGSAVSLRVIVRDRSSTEGGIPFFNDARQLAEVELVLNDDASGQDIRSRLVRSSVASRDVERADLLLISRLASDIRGVLGLSGYPYYPVAGAKRDVVRPVFRDDESGDGRFSDLELRSDPLLNGSVTPTTADLDPEERAKPRINISKPLLSSEPEPDPTVEPTAAPAMSGSGTSAPAIQEAQASEGILDDEPCIITVENDCSDPDSR
ncbi:MAG: hypothetical protein RIA09_13625 [Hoeflea sp.]|uniref:hypothetical protein n=1 Tax=Hoeflea sp. TaxID=1940281 RepID=UPI0032EB4314